MGGMELMENFKKELLERMIANNGSIKYVIERNEILTTTLFHLTDFPNSKFSNIPKYLFLLINLLQIS